jgi:thymidylate kinase
MDVKLEIIEKTLDELHDNNINYCHFKSNEHLAASFSGDTDLDILFDYKQYKEIESLLISLGFRKFNTIWFVSYPYVEDYIYITEGKIVHIHAHFKLILGESKVKSYIFPWDDVIFKNKIYLNEYNIYTTSPTDELLLLIVRTALKLPKTNKNYAKNTDTKDSIREFEWLKERVTENEIINLVKIRLGENYQENISNIYNENITYENIQLFYKQFKEEFDTFRRYSYFKSKIVQISRRIAQKFSSVNKRFNLLEFVKNHRTLNKDGLIISIMGSDGSGKSTQVKLLTRILLTKMDVRYVYMGSGNGPASWHRNILNFIKKVISKNKNKEVIKDDVNKKIPVSNSINIKSLWYVIYSLSLAIEKKRKLKKLKLFKKLGMISITDRYPQTQIFGYNDGPLLRDYKDSSNSILKNISEYEYNLYNLSENIYPDIVIKLITNPNILYERRKNEMTLNRIIEKQDGIKSIEFGSKTKVIEIDAGLSKEEIMKKITNIIGKNI